MKKRLSIIKNTARALITLGLAFGVSLLIQRFFGSSAPVTAIFVLAVFLISLVTNGYVYGVAATLVSVFAVNYAFTFPFFKLNFTIQENLVSAVIMMVVTLLTCTLTTKVRRQEALRAESELERMRANLLRAVSHDLRTPLTTIYGSSSALLESKGSFSPEQEAKILLGIKEDADWLMQLVENLLSVTRLDGGKLRLIKTSTVLDELIDSVLVKFKKRYPKQEVKLDLPDGFVAIPMDATLIEQVLVNLLENAVQHARGMTELSLRVFLLAQKAIFEVSDNGCGIDESRLSNIFSGVPYTGEAPSDGQKNCSGIGLSVCATIIKAHGGDIRAENRKAGGTVIRFSLNAEEDTNA